MRLIRLSEYQAADMQLAKPITDNKGRVLLAAGSTIHPKYLQKLAEFGVRYSVVEDAESKGITLEEMLDTSKWMDAIQVVKLGFEQVNINKAIPLLKNKELQRNLWLR